MSPSTTNDELPRQYPKCLNPEARRELVANQQRDQTGYLYHLWTARDYEKNVLRTYISPKLAKHDALCWLISQQNKVGASRESYWEHSQYADDHPRCCYYCTDDTLFDELGVTFFAWTTEKHLY